MRAAENLGRFTFTFTLTGATPCGRSIIASSFGADPGVQVRT
jgi:hypothetical protein